MSTRADIAAALDGLTVDLGPDYPPAVLAGWQYPPDSLQPFAAWPVWVATTYRTACIAEDSWQVLVVLPGGVRDAWAAYGEALLLPVRDALSKVGGVPRCEPVTLTSGDGTQVIPAMGYTLNT